MGFFRVLEALQEINLSNLTADAVMEKPEVALDANRAQMMAGKGIDGASLPKYVDDPYFKTPAAAVAYGRFKQRVTPQTPAGVMNFNINGYTHGQMFLTVSGQTFTISSNVPWGRRIDPKTGGQAFGLSAESARELWSSEYGPRVAQVVKEKYGFK